MRGKIILKRIFLDKKPLSEAVKQQMSSWVLRSSSLLHLLLVALWVGAALCWSMKKLDSIGLGKVRQHPVEGREQDSLKSHRSMEPLMTEYLCSQKWPGKPRVTAQSHSLIWAGLHPETALGTGHCNDTQQATFVRAPWSFSWSKAPV